MSKIDQKKYLKKYLSGEKKKKKKEKYNFESKSRVKIIDDDIDVRRGHIDDDDELFLTGEDAPQVVGIVDDRAPEIKAIEDFRTSKKWKSVSRIGSNLEDSQAINISAINSNKIERDVSKTSRDKTNTDIVCSKFKQRNNLSDDLKSRYGTQGSDDDLSPRRKYREKSEDYSPARKTEMIINKKRHSSEDLSPPRKQERRNLPKKSADEDKEKEHTSDYASPPRRKPRGKDNDFSPPRRSGMINNKKRDSCEDLSPPRSSFFGKSRGRCNDFSPPRRAEMIKNKKRYCNEDLSPPRQENHKSSKNSDEIKEKGYSSDYSPPRKSTASSSKRHAKSMHLKKQQQGSIDSSPQRSKKETCEDSSKRKAEVGNSTASLDNDNFKGKGKTGKTLDGKRAGLQDAKSLKKESQILQKKEDEVFAKMPADVTGKNAEIVVRDKRPKTAAELRREREEEKEKSEREREKQEAYSRWGVGLKQIESYQNKIAEETYEKSKPLARYSDDADLDEHLKKQERDGDPMLAYIREKNKDAQKNANKPSIPIYKGPFPENRFNIRPGYRWDGVDRSNGYEKKWFDVQSQKKAIQEEAYKYSIEDM